MAELKLTPEFQEQFFGLLREGLDATVAADMCHVSYVNVWRWRKKGENAPDLEPYGSFAKKWKEAVGEAEVTHLRNIKSQGYGDWRASAWYLEKRRSDRYANKIVIEHEAKQRLADDLIKRLREGLDSETFQKVERLLMDSCVDEDEGTDEEP